MRYAVRDILNLQKLVAPCFVWSSILEHENMDHILGRPITKGWKEPESLRTLELSYHCSLALLTSAILHEQQVKLFFV